MLVVVLVDREATVVVSSGMELGSMVVVEEEVSLAEEVVRSLVEDASMEVELASRLGEVVVRVERSVSVSVSVVRDAERAEVLVEGEGAGVVVVVADEELSPETLNPSAAALGLTTRLRLVTAALVAADTAVVVAEAVEDWPRMKTRLRPASAPPGQYLLEIQAKKRRKSSAPVEKTSSSRAMILL